jgi:hypothetical protein
VCWNPRFDSIQRIGSMTAARRTHGRSVGAAAWGFTVGVLLYLYDLRAMLRRATRTMTGR